MQVAVDGARVMKLSERLCEGKADLAKLQWARILGQPIDAVERIRALK